MHTTSRGVSRRDALKLAGAAGLAGVVTVFPGRRSFAAVGQALELSVERTRITVDGVPYPGISIGGSIPAVSGVLAPPSGAVAVGRVSRIA